MEDLPTDMHVSQIAGRTVLICGERGANFEDAGQFADLVGEALSVMADDIIIPAGRLTPAFFRLSSGLAGEALQKFVNYRIRTVVIGDIGGVLEGSEALQDFVRESNRGASTWFLPDLAAFEKKLG